MPLTNVGTRILVFYGLGGIGKSELLDQCQHLAREHDVPVARIDPQVQATIFEFLVAIYQQLHVQGLSFPRFEEGLSRHQAIESKLFDRSSLPTAVLQMFAKGSQHYQEKIQPVQTLSFEQSMAVSAQIYQLVSRADGDFWMKPDDELTDLLVADINSYVGLRRVVLFLDTYEVMGAFDDWVRKRVATKLASHALLVIAGRRPLEGNGWHEYAQLIRQVNLQPLSVAEALTYLQKMGVADEQITNTMAAFADGHPLTLSLLANQADGLTLADLKQIPEQWQILDVLLKSITRHVASSLRTTLEACAILRVVNEESLAYVLSQADVHEVYDEVRRLEFAKERSGGIALHDVVRVALNEEVRKSTPARYRSLHVRAAEYYEQALAQSLASDRERLGLERLYHRVCADEQAGIRIFQDQAEKLVRFRLPSRLHLLLHEVEQYSIREEDSRLWIVYYRARLALLRGMYPAAESLYQEIAAKRSADRLLAAYVLCDLGQIYSTGQRLAESGGVARALSTLERCELTAPSIDGKLISLYAHRRSVYVHTAKWDKVFVALDKQLAYAQGAADVYGTVEILATLKGTYGLMGDWASAFAQVQKARELLGTLPDNTLLLTKLIESAFWVPLWSGRYREAECDVQEGLATVEDTDVVYQAEFYMDRMLALGMQGRLSEALLDMEQHTLLRGRQGQGPSASALGFLGLVLLKAGKTDEALQNLEQTLRAKQAGDKLGVPEVLCWLGELYELRHDFSHAREYYRRCVEEWGWVGRQHFRCGALIGLARTSTILGDYSGIASWLSQAETLAERFEYNEHLAAIQLLRGRLLWQAQVPGPTGGFDAVLRCYQNALIHALRYNRFLLDEALSGKPKGSALLPIIPTCLDQHEGHRMLSELRDWWLAGRNTVGTSRAATVSRLPEDLPLLQAEEMARDQEPGDGSPQRCVTDQIESCLGLQVQLLPGESILHIETPPIQQAGELPSAVEALMRLTNVDRPEDIGKSGPSVAARAFEPNMGVESLRKFEVLFGRDSLRVALDLAGQYPLLLRNTILALAQLQGTQYDTRREEEPGRIVHESRDPTTDRIAQAITETSGWSWPYYGSVDATLMYVLAVDRCCSQTREGIDFLDSRYVGRDAKEHTIGESVDRAVEWIERRLDSNREGLMEFKALFKGSIKNQVWKDSWDSYHHSDGRLANHEMGIASIEVQGYTFDALVAAADQYARRSAGIGGQADSYAEKSSRLLRRAQKLRQSVVQHLWVEDVNGGYFALGTDRDEAGNLRPLRVRTSNMGHLLCSNILMGNSEEDVSRRETIVRTLLSPGMLNASGIRTLARHEIRFRAGSYHNGSVWWWDTYYISQGLEMQGYLGLSRELNGRLYAAQKRLGTFLSSCVAGMERARKSTPISSTSGTTPTIE